MPLDLNPWTTQDILINGNTYRVTDFITTTSIDELPTTTITLTPTTVGDCDINDFISENTVARHNTNKCTISKQDLKPMIIEIVKELLESKGFILGRIPETIEDPPIE